MMTQAGVTRWSGVAATITSGRGKLLILATAVLFSFVLSFAIGRYPVSPVSTVKILASKLVDIPADWPPQARTVVLDIRLPRIIAAMLVGLALSTSGAAYQGLFRNPLVSPDILGVSAGAAFGGSLGILLTFSPLGVQALAFICGLLAVISTYAVAMRFGRTAETTLLLILAGIIIGAVFTAFTSLIRYVAEPDTILPAITYWLMGGGIASVAAGDVYVAIGPIGGWRVDFDAPEVDPECHGLRRGGGARARAQHHPDSVGDDPGCDARHIFGCRDQRRGRSGRPCGPAYREGLCGAEFHGAASRVGPARRLVRAAHG